MSYRNKFGLVLPLKGEKWKPITGWPWYEVSNLGRVKSIKRIIHHIGGKKMHEGDYLLNLKPNSKGYFKVRLYSGKNKKDFGVHQLVAIHFKRKPKEGKTEIHHNDSIKTNNIPSNLRWLTKKEHAPITRSETGFGQGCKGEAHGMCRITPAIVLKIRALFDCGKYSMGALGKKFSITKTHVSRIINRKSWKHI